MVSARGLDLDLYISPRKESCTYLESVVSLPALPAQGGSGPASAGSAGPVAAILELGSSGSFRLAWDGVELGRSEEVHPELVLDRAAARVPADGREHLLSVKVCSAAMADAGRVRVRFVDDRYQPVAVESSSDLERLGAVAAQVRSRLPATGAADGSSSGGRAVERIKTPLEQAVETADQASSAQRLAAALVRTLGGAEDLRSPRAPGLLDGVVADAALRPDELAIAAYVSPSPSNRSGWLGQALERALAAHDEDTAVFAERALVESQVQAGMSELAFANARREPLGSRRDPHARLLRAHTLAALGGPGLVQSALSELRAIVAELGDRTPIAVWRSIATLGAQTDPSDPSAILEAMKHLRSLGPEFGGARYARAFSLFGAEALERAARTEMGGVHSARELAEIGALLFDTGRYGAAREAFALGAELSPNTAAALVGLGESELVLSADAGAAGRALAALGRAKELEPGQAKLAAEIGFRQPKSVGPAAAGSVAEDLAYLVEPEVFLARARSRPATVGAQFDRTLHWRRVVRFHPDRRISQLMHWAREIVVEPRTDEDRYEDMPGGSANVELILARLHRKDGTVLPPEEQETPNGAPPSIRWPELHRGDVVEVAVRTWTAGPVNRRGDIPFYFVDYVGSLETRPVLYNEVVIDTPPDAPLGFDVLHGKADRVIESDKEGRKVTQLIWEAPPLIADEPLAPPQSELLPVVVGSSYRNWGAFLDWYRGAVEGFTVPDEQIRRVADELTAGKAGHSLSREEKITALFNFVADDIRYVNFVSGEWWLPNRPQQLLARRQGDCDDKAMLLITLLRAIGIHADEVLVQTRYTQQPSVLQSDRVAVPLFDHGIAYLPGEGKEPGRYLDATSPESRLGPVPAMDSGGMALLFKHEDGGAAPGASPTPLRVLSVPDAAPADHGVDAHWTLTLTSTGEGELAASERHVGDAAFLLRTQLQQEDARAQWVEQELLSGWFSSIEIDPGISFRGELPGGAAELEYHARSRSLARREGDDLVVVVAPRMPITAELAPLTERTLPVWLPANLAPRHSTLELHIEAPSSHRFAELPPDSVEDGKSFGTAKLSFSRPTRGRGGVESVTVRREISFAQWRIEVAQYPEWRRWLQRIDRLMRRGVRLVPR